MGATNQFLGGVAIIVLASLCFSAARGDLTLGGVADWVSGLATAIGVIVSLRTAQAALDHSRRAEAAADRRLRAQRDHELLQRYADSVAIIAVGRHRLTALQTVIKKEGARVDKHTLLMFRRMVEADQRLIRSVPLTGLAPAVAHQVTSFEGVLGSVLDVLDYMAEHIGSPDQDRRRIQAQALGTAEDFVTTGKQITKNLGIAIREALLVHGITPPPGLADALDA